MSTVGRIARNSAFLLGSRVATKIISFFTLLLLARYLGPTDFGKFSFVFAFIYFFAFIPDLGIHNILVRDAAKEQKIAGKLIGNATIIKSLLSTIAIFLSFIVINLMDYPASTKNALYVASLGLLVSSISAYGIIYEVKLRMEYSLIFSIVGRFSLLIFVMFGTLKSLTLLFFVFGSVVADFVHNFLMVAFSKKLVKVDFKLDYSMVGNILHEALPIAVASVFIMIYFKVDILMLSYFKSDVDVGFYSAAYRLTEALLFIPSIYMTSMFPLMSKHFGKSLDLFCHIYIKSFRYLFASGLLIAVIISFIAEPIILNLYGKEYISSIIVLQILIWATAIMFINILQSFTYISSGNQKIIAKITAFGALLNVGLNLMLIPLYSYAGAAIATVVTEFVVMIFGMYWIKNNIVNKTLFKEIFYPFVGACFVSVFFNIFIHHINIIFLCILSVLIFIGVLYQTGWIDSDDKKLLKKLIESL